MQRIRISPGSTDFIPIEIRQRQSSKDVSALGDPLSAKGPDDLFEESIPSV